MRSPGRTRTGRRAALPPADGSVSPSSVSTQAVLGTSDNRPLMASPARLRARVSSHLPMATRVMMAVAKVSQLDLPGIRARLAGNPAPDFTASTLDGQAVSLSDFRGKVVLLYFWATWCGQCRLEQPVVAEVYGKYRGRGLVTFGVTGEDQATVRHYLEENRLRLPILLDSKRTLRRLYGSLAIPTLVFINSEGVVTEDYVGFLDESDLRLALQSAGLQVD